MFFLFLAIAILAADLASKWFVMERLLDVGRGGTGLVTVLPFFNIVAVWNKGISFGIFNHETDYGPVVLTVLALGISAFFTVNF